LISISTATSCFRWRSCSVGERAKRASIFFCPVYWTVPEQPPLSKKMRLAKPATVSNFERLNTLCVGVRVDSGIRLFLLFFLSTHMPPSRTMNCAKWLQPPTSTTKLTLFHSNPSAHSPPPCSNKNAPRFARRSVRTFRRNWMVSVLVRISTLHRTKIRIKIKTTHFHPHPRLRPR